MEGSQGRGREAHPKAHSQHRWSGTWSAGSCAWPAPSRPMRSPGGGEPATAPLSVRAPEAPPPERRRLSIPRLLLVSEGGAPRQGSGRPRAAAGRAGSARQRSASDSATVPRPAPGPPPAFWLPSPHSRPARALPEDGAAVLRGHSARAPGRAGPVAVLGSGRVLQSLLRLESATPRASYFQCVQRETAAHAEDAGTDAGGTALAGLLPSPPRPARTSWAALSGHPGPQQQSVHVSVAQIPGAWTFTRAPLAGCLGAVFFFCPSLTLTARHLAPLNNPCVLAGKVG